MKWLLLFLFAFSFCMHASSQEAEQILFHAGDRICFVGNSITNNGEFYNMVNLFYATRFPEEKMTFFNCGVSGNTTGDALIRLDSDILIHQPTWSVVMFGMNDVKRDLYNPARKNDPDILVARRNALGIYRKNLEIIIQRLLKSNSKVIIQKPTIYDQTGALKSPNMFGVNYALEECCRYIDTLALKYHLPVVDYWSILNSINHQIQQKDSSATIIGSDRVHPQSPGHFIMAYQFLRSTLKPSMVSDISLDAVNLGGHCGNCAIDSPRRNRNGIFFSCIEKSLPFPVRDELTQALSFVPFIDEYDREMIRVSKLKKGNYRLIIDGKEVGKFSNKEWKKGINLALIKETPQYLQASKILSLFTRYRTTEGNIRSLRFVEYNFLNEYNNANLDSVDAYLRNILSAKYSGTEYRDYYESQFKRYIQFKPQEEALKRLLLEMLDSIYALNKPSRHSFELVRE